MRIHDSLYYQKLSLESHAITTRPSVQDNAIVPILIYITIINYDISFSQNYNYNILRRRSYSLLEIGDNIIQTNSRGSHFHSICCMGS